MREDGGKGERGVRPQNMWPLKRKKKTLRDCKLNSSALVKKNFFVLSGPNAGH